MHPGPLLEANLGAQQTDGPRPLGLRALWLLDPKSQVFNANELICFLGDLADETPCEYEVYERNTSPDIAANLSWHLMRLLTPCPI